MITEITFAALKSAISDGGHATSETIGARLVWGSERLGLWLQRPEFGFGFAPGDVTDMMPAIRALCEHGIRAKYTQIGQ